VCDWSTEEAYSSMEPDPAYLHFCWAFMLSCTRGCVCVVMSTLHTLLTFLIDVTCSMIISLNAKLYFPSLYEGQIQVTPQNP
jgi:hypothetical protein